MLRVLIALVLLIAGPALGWLLLAGFCSLPGLSSSVACGHNAYIWLPLFIPLGVGICWLLALRGRRLAAARRRSARGRFMPAHSTHAPSAKGS
jgi:hypothetical protein